MPGLIDPSKFVISRASHMADGKELHEAKDCPRDHTCPVWSDFHVEVPSPLTRWLAEAPAWLHDAIVAYYASYPGFPDLPLADAAWDAARIEDFLLFTVRSLQVEARDGGYFHYEVTETPGVAPR